MSGQLHVAETAAVTPLNIAAFVISVLAWATALIALLWNIVQWLLTPGRAHVYVGWGHHKTDGDKVASSKMSNIRVVRGPWYDLGEGYIALVEIEIVNRGRMKLGVREISMKFAKNNYWASGVLTTGPTLPCSIDAYHSEKWTVEIKELQKVVAVGLGSSRVPIAVQPDSVRPVVRLADRRTISPWYSIEVGWETPEQNPLSAST